MNLSERLFSPGTKLSEVPPDFQGVSHTQWLLWDISRQCEEWRKSDTRKVEDAPITKKRIYTSRDGYGMKSM